MNVHVGERVGPFVVVANESTIPARKRRVVVRCVVCERVSEMNERSLLDKRTEEQRACAKCRVYTTNGTWVKGWKAKMENAAAEANRLNEENARLRGEIDKVMRERDEWRDKFHALNQTAGELCNACGWAFMIPGEPCRCEVVRERDEARAEVDHWRVKAEAYGGMVDGCGPALEAAGHPIDPFQPDGRVGGIARSVAALVKERDKARAERDAAIARITEVGVMVATNGNLLAKDAYRRGAEAMREHIAEVAGRNAALEWVVELVRAMPIPEET